MDAKSDTAKIQRKSGEVKSRRYESALRQAQAQQTRQAVLDAGRSLILERGYARTTIRQVAERAGVAVETVYLHVRSKPALLQTLLDIAIGGDEEPIPVAERAWVREVLSAPDVRARLTLLAERFTVIHAGLAPLSIATRAAAAADEAAAEMWATRKAARLRAVTEIIGPLLAGGTLPQGVTTDEARDRLIALLSPDLYGLLVLELGWSPPRYTAWLTVTLIQQLLEA